MLLLHEVAVTKSVGGTVTQSVDYTYDAFDRLVKRVTDLDGAGVGAAVTEYFAYDGHDVALKFDASGTLTKRYLNGPAADQVLAEEQVATAIASSDRTYWALRDNASRSILPPKGVKRLRSPWGFGRNSRGVGCGCWPR